MRAGIERTLQVLTDRLRGNDLAKAAPSPGRYGGTWNLDVSGHGFGATTNDVLTKPMVVGAPFVVYP